MPIEQDIANMVAAGNAMADALRALPGQVRAAYADALAPIVFHVNAATGNDAALGTSAQTPLRTFLEAVRRSPMGRRANISLAIAQTHDIPAPLDTEVTAIDMVLKDILVQPSVDMTGRPEADFPVLRWVTAVTAGRGNVCRQLQGTGSIIFQNILLDAPGLVDAAQNQEHCVAANSGDLGRLNLSLQFGRLRLRDAPFLRAQGGHTSFTVFGVTVLLQGAATRRTAMQQRSNATCAWNLISSTLPAGVVAKDLFHNVGAATVSGTDLTPKGLLTNVSFA